MKIEFGRQGEILTAIIGQNGQIVFRSPITTEEFKSNNVHLLRYRRVASRQHMVKKNITRDILNPREVGHCTKCKKDRIIAWVQNSNMTRIRVCTRCETQLL